MKSVLKKTHVSVKSGIVVLNRAKAIHLIFGHSKFGPISSKLINFAQFLIKKLGKICPYRKKLTQIMRRISTARESHETYSKEIRQITLNFRIVRKQIGK
jgi:hypothetical protein